MASLRSYLPPAGSTVWRNQRQARTSSSSEIENGLSRTRIKHVVIREVWKRDVPSPHALYKIDVMTQSNHWFILRRYKEFNSLHLNLMKQYNIPNDMLPAKKLFSNLSLTHLEKRRNALEHYLQRLINSHHDIAESQELFQFLNVQTHDVLCVTRQLAKVLDKEGRNILASGSVFTFSPTQMYCITRQLQLPHVAIAESDSSDPGEEMIDLGYLYGFIQELKNLCVSGIANPSSPCQELISNQAFDISLFKSLQKLQIEKCHISVIDGLFQIQKQLTHITLKNCLRTMKEFLVDCAMQKRGIKQAVSNVESWRNTSTTKLTDNRVVVRPWILLTHINMSHNNISTLDHSLKLLPSLEQLDLSYNDFVHLDLGQLTSSTLTFLNLSHNRIHYVSATSKDLRNLKSLLLINNKLQTLEGIECLRGLVELDVRYNEIKAVEELVKISSLLHLRILALTGNPCVVSKSYRIQVFCQLKARELILDGIKITEAEKAKVHLIQGRKVSSTDGEQTNKRNVNVQGHANDEGKKKFTSYRDDDQDSGFGGNYTGSIDEGGLVFDWSCYSDNIHKACNFFPYETEPSTSKTALKYPTSQMHSSGSEVMSSSDCGVSSNTNSHLPHSAGYTSNVKNNLMSKSSEVRHSDGNMRSDTSDYRVKQYGRKRNIKSPSLPPSTLLQLSLKEDESKKDNTRDPAIKGDHNCGIHMKNSACLVNDTLKSKQKNTNSVLDNTAPVQDCSNCIQTDLTFVEDRSNSIQNNPKSVEDPRNISKKNANSIQDFGNGSAG